MKSRDCVYGFGFFLALYIGISLISCVVLSAADDTEVSEPPPVRGCLVIYPTLTFDFLDIGTMNYQDYDNDFEVKTSMQYMPLVAGAGLGFGFWRVFYMNTKFMIQTSAGGGFIGYGAAVDMDLYLMKRSPIRPFFHMGDGAMMSVSHAGDSTGTGFMFEIGGGLSARISKAMRLAGKLSFSLNRWDFTYEVGHNWIGFPVYGGHAYEYLGVRIGTQADLLSD